MASGAIYAPSPALSAWEYSGYPYDNHHPEYTPYPSSGLHPQHSHYQQSYQVWNPPSRYSTGSYPDPSFHGSPPPLRNSLANDPAFAYDPNTNPDNWYHPNGTQSAAPFPAHSHSGLDVPHGFVAQANSLHNTSHHAHSYHDDMTGQLSPPQPIYFIPRSASSSSASDSSVYNSQINQAPRSSARNLEYPYEYSDAPTRAMPAIEAPYAEAQSRPRDGKRRGKRRSRRASEHADNRAEEAPGPISSLADHPADADGNSQALMSSMTAPPPLGLAEPSKDIRARTSSRLTLPDLDNIDEMDKTNPYGINVHHKGPYEAVAAILNETNPIDSPLLRAKGIQQQVSANAPRRPSRHVKVRTIISDFSYFSHVVQSEPNANPMSLNLQPGQILQSSIYQPTQPSHFPPEFTQGALPPNHSIHPTHRPVEQTMAQYDTVATGSPLRRNQTLPAPSSVRGPPEQPYLVSPPVASEAQEYQRPYHTDPNLRRSNPPPSFPEASQHTRPPLQIAPVASVYPPEAPPTPDLDQRFMRTLYLANPDEASGTRAQRPHEPRLPSAPEAIHPSTGRRSERSSRTHHDSFYGGQPLLAITRAPTDSEGRSRGSRSAPPSRATASDSPPRFEPPSQTVAAMKAQYAGQAASVSSSSSRTSSSLAPRHVPKRLVMPSPLSSATENGLSMVPSGAASSRLSDGRSGQVLRKRASSAAMPPRPQRSQTLPPQTVNTRGVFSFFKFGKGSKPTVREVRVTEPPRAGMGEKGQQLRVPTREEPRKLSKRR